jgi:hypothetical protein
VKRALELAFGLREIGGGRKRMVLFAMAFYASSNGLVHANDRNLRNAVEMGRDLYERIVEELEADGWLRRQGDHFLLAIGKMEANQRFGLNSAEYLAARGYNGGPKHETWCLGTLNPFKKGFL